MFEPYHLLFYKGESLLGRLIRKVSHGKYSHVTIFLDRIHCLESSWKNPSVIRHFSYKYKEYDVYKLKVRLTDIQKQLITQYIIENIRTGYDWKFFISRGFHFLFDTKIINSKKYLTCDELIFEAHKIAGILLIEKDEVLTPHTLSQSKHLEKISN